MKSAGQSLLTERLCNERNYMVIPDIIIVAQGITFTVSVSLFSKEFKGKYYIIYLYLSSECFLQGTLPGQNNSEQ